MANSVIKQKQIECMPSRHQRMLGHSVRPCWAQQARMVMRLPVLQSSAHTLLEAIASTSIGLWRALLTSSGFQVVPLHSTISSLMFASLAEDC